MRPAGALAGVVLDVVEPVLVGLPDLDPRTGQRGAVGVGDGALDPAGLAGGTEGEVIAEFDRGESSTKNGPKTVASVAPS